MPRTVATPTPRFRNFADLLTRLGGIDPSRICLDPPPGRATKRDVLRMNEQKLGLFELVDGTIVEKPMGFPESHLAIELGRLVGNFVVERDLGFLGGADALIEFSPKIVREPDLCFISWRRRPEGTVPLDPIGKLIPNLAVEVLSPKNTAAEMRIKLGEYFAAGVELVWIIDPATRTADAYTGPDERTHVPASGTLDGRDVLPGFRLPLAKLFERVEPPAAPKKPRKKK